MIFMISSGYGNRIYKKRKKRWFSPLIFTLVLGTALFIWFSNEKQSRKETAAGAGLNNEIIDSGISDPTKKSTVHEQFKSRGSAEIGVEDSRAAEKLIRNPLSQTGERISPIKNSSRLQLSRARAYFKRRQYQMAVELYEAIEETDDNINLEIGQCYYFLEEYDNARSSFQKVLGNTPDNFIAKKYLAFTFYHLDQLETSLEFAQEALSQSRDRELQAFLSRVSREKDLMKEYSDKQTPNFKIIFSRIEHSDIKYTVIDILNDAYRFVGKQINHFPESTISVVLYNERNFFDITRSPAWAGGLFDGKIRIPIKGIRGREKLLKRVLVHEFTHALVHDLTSRCPLWINEGLAEYFSGSHPRVIGQVIPLNQLEKNFPFRDIRMVGLAYLESYSAVQYLISKFGMYRIRELLDSLGKGVEFSRAFKSVFLISYREFLNTWGKS